MAFLGHLFGFADGNQDAAQVVEQDEMIGNDVGHEISPLKQKRAREYMPLAPVFI